MITLAQDSGGLGGSAGPIGLVIVVLLLVATVFLIRNMDGRLKRLPREFPDQRPEPREPGGPPEA